MDLLEDLRGRVAIVTGAGRGIGRETALLLARHGTAVLVNDLGSSVDGLGSDVGCADQVVAEIRRLGGDARANYGDISNWDQANDIVSSTMREFGRLDFVVNNAGIIKDSVFYKMAIDDWARVLQVNLFGAFYISRIASEYFRKQESGSFVHLTSNAGLIGAFGQVNYATSKLGLVALSRSIAVDMARFKVRSNCVAPFAAGRMVDTLLTHTDEQRRRVERIRMMPPSTVAPLVVYLLSGAADRITGQVFTVRKNEIFLMSQPRPVRSIHNSQGWSIEQLAKIFEPSIVDSLVPLELPADVFSWDPI